MSEYLVAGSHYLLKQNTDLSFVEAEELQSSEGMTRFDLRLAAAVALLELAPEF
jgi:hypothetical protein